MVNYFVCILNAKITILRGKDFWCSKFLWKRTWKESSMFLLRNWNYLIMSSSSRTLLINILIFDSDIWQYLFCFWISCIQQLHWLIILSNNFFCLGVEFFSTPKWKKLSVRKRNYFVLSRCAWTWNLKFFSNIASMVLVTRSLSVQCFSFDLE